MPLPPSLPDLPEDYTPQFFGNDVVAGVEAGETFLAKVLRCWSDEDGLLPPGHVPTHPLDRPLMRGEVGVSHLTNGALAIVPEASLKLFQREFMKGDIVKRSLTDHESALILDVKTEVRLQHVFSQEEIGWVNYKDVTNALEVDARDRVVYNNWIGTVEEVFENGLVETRNGELYRLAEMGGLLEVGRKVDDVLPKYPHDRAAAVARLPTFSDPMTDRVIRIDPVVVYVIWNAINQKLPVSEQGKYQEPEPFWFGENLKKLTLIDATHSQPAVIGATVKFQNKEAENKYGTRTTDHANGTVKVGTMKIVESRSTLVLRWQTGKETEEPSTGFSPYHNVDDYESWPGEHVMWRGDNGERRHAVIQSFDPFQRVARLLFKDTNTEETVPVMEIDPGGRTSTNGYGAGIGLQVLLCDHNGSVPPEVTSLGQNETPVKNMWSRHEFDKLGEEHDRNPTKFVWHSPERNAGDVDWFGEVVNIHLDGKLSVKLANGLTRTIGVENAFILNDPSGGMADELMPGMEDGEPGMLDLEYGIWAEHFNEVADVFGNEAAEMRDQSNGSFEGFQEAIQRMRQRRAVSEASWETMSQDGDVDTEGEVVEVDKVEEEETRKRKRSKASPPEDKVGEISPLRQPTSISQSSRPSTTLVNQSEAGPSSSTNVLRVSAPTQSLGDENCWASFELLEEAPSDHHFFNEASSGAAAKSYHSRIQKEHRALKSSLPENILVRTYEDRLDLMRVLIIGPEGTPYSDAPFIFDVYLNPLKFPNEPPVVHFHSHTNGHGRCNPNLYEEGKVCLSVLGTWSGDESESWIPAKSSLLQVFVSISGLVLVRSPYHCEPAFAKLEGTREGKVNSRLYSEKAYVLSRSFVRTALERPPTGFENELRYFYITNGRLNTVIDHAQRLIEKGEVGRDEEDENAEMWKADAMGRLTMGAIITLKRSIISLQKIWDKECS